MNKKLVLLFTILLSMFISVQLTFGQCADDDPSSEGIVPTLVSGNTPGVTDYIVKIDPPDGGTYALGTGSVTISFSSIIDPV